MVSFICCSVFSFKISPSNLTLTDMSSSVKMFCAEQVIFLTNNYELATAKVLFPLEMVA